MAHLAPAIRLSADHVLGRAQVVWCGAVGPRRRLGEARTQSHRGFQSAAKTAPTVVANSSSADPGVGAALVSPAGDMIPACINPRAGNAEAARGALQSVGEFDIRDVPPASLATQVKAAIADGARRILVAGGDGSIGS